MKKYKLGFDVSGLLIFLNIMIPDFIRLAVPAPYDIMRNESVTPAVDTMGSVFQVMLVRPSLFTDRKNNPYRCWVLYHLR